VVGGAFLWICLAPAQREPVTAAVAGVLALVPCWLALVYITFTTNSTHWVLFTLALVWAADTGAFFAGRWLGRVPLAPRVSPKKTWEGVFGGMVMSGWWPGSPHASCSASTCGSSC
jgi:phosphatidate cytidylyltransferase